MKLMFVFALLSRGSMGFSEALEYFRRVSVYKDLNRRFLGLAEPDLGPTLLKKLKWAGAIVQNGDVLIPQMAA